MSWFNNLKIGTKLMGAFGLVTLLLGVLGYVGWSNTTKFAAAFDSLYKDRLVPAGELACMEAELMELRMNGYRYQMPGGAARAAEFRASDAPLFAGLDENYRKYVGTNLVQAEKDAIKEWEEAFPAYLATRERMIGLAIAGQQGEADLVRKNENTPLGAKCSAVLAKLVQIQLDTGAADDARINAQAKVSIWWIVALLICAPLIALGTGLVLTRTITSSLMHVVERATTAATGDLTVRVDVRSKDELGQMGEQLNVMMKTFDENMQQVAQTSQAVASAAQQLGAGAGQISSGAQEQASSLEETAASLEEITSTVKQNADNAQQANQLANGSREVAEKGGRVVSTAVEAMSAINQSSKQIADIIGTIDEIAFQTNLLALNAAVEAARAGEQGRGFAVVATEVRNLAQRSATSAKEIKSLIQDSVRKVEGGTELVNQSGQTLSEIVTSVKRVTDIVAEIAAASREQSTGIDQVNKAITQMDQVTQSNASQTEELNATAEGLAGQAVQLQALVSRFKLSGQTAKAPVARAAAKSAAAKPAKRHLGGPVAKAAAPVASAALAKGGDEWEKGFEEY